MKKLNLLFLALIFIQCNAQLNHNRDTKQKIAIADLKRDFSCKSEKISIHFPDVYAKNEDNYYNQQLIKGILDFSDLSSITEKKPKEVVDAIINQREKDCLEEGTNEGLTSINFKTEFNNDRILSLTLQVETLAGNLVFEEMYYNFDIKKKQNLKIESLFSEKDQKTILKKINDALKLRLQEYSTEEKEIDQQREVDVLLAKSNIVTKDQVRFFKIKENGIEFMANYGLQRGILPIENNVFISFIDLNPYLKIEFKKLVF